MDNEAQQRRSGLFASLPSKSITGYFFQALSFLPSILLGYFMMYISKAMFAVDLYQYGVWIVLISFFILREVLAAINPKIFDLDVRRSRRDTFIIIGAYLLGIIMPIIVQTLLPIQGFWNFLIAVLLALASIYLPCILFGSPELKAAILPTKRETHNL